MQLTIIYSTYFEGSTDYGKYAMPEEHDEIETAIAEFNNSIGTLDINIDSHVSVIAVIEHGDSTWGMSINVIGEDF